jgi:5-methylcytosine-specific restriction endonuclease McrA
MPNVTEPRLCSATIQGEPCGKPATAKGLCSAHYQRSRNGRDMDAPWYSRPSRFTTGWAKFLPEQKFFAVTFLLDRLGQKPVREMLPVIMPCENCGTLFIRQSRRSAMYCGANCNQKAHYKRSVKGQPTGPCEIEGCDREYKYGLFPRYCEMHYARLRRHGDPKKRMYKGPKSTDDDLTVMRRTECVNGHDMTDPANQYHPPKEPHKTKCYACIQLRAHERRALLNDAVVDGLVLTAESIRQRFEMFGWRCWMCGTEADMLSPDHVKPLKAKGGPGLHIPANIRPSCQSCNNKKKAKWPIDTSTAHLRLDPARLP